MPAGEQQRLIISGDTQRQNRVPPGQREISGFPVLTAGRTPLVDVEKWRFRIFGLVEEEVVLTYEQFRSLPVVHVQTDFHCVTGWSRLGNVWEGVLVKEVLKLARPKPEAAFVMLHCLGGYTTNLELDLLYRDDVLFAWGLDGQPLHPDHGFPLRLIVPERYGWKSAKWVIGMELMAENVPGFWEERGYNMRADVWEEERYWDD